MEGSIRMLLMCTCLVLLIHFPIAEARVSAKRHFEGQRERRSADPESTNPLAEELASTLMKSRRHKRSCSCTCDGEAATMYPGGGGGVSNRQGNEGQRPPPPPPPPKVWGEGTRFGIPYWPGRG